MARVEFFAAWFSCFKPGSLVNPAAAAGVAALRPQWERFAGLTRAQKDRAARLSGAQCESQCLAKAPRVALEGSEKFRPHGIVGNECEKGAHVAGTPCTECEAARRRFAAAVQREDAAVLAAAEPQTYSALYDEHWRAEALRLMTSGPAGAAPAAAHSRLAATPSLESDPFECGAGACTIS